MKKVRLESIWTTGINYLAEIEKDAANISEIIIDQTVEPEFTQLRGDNLGVAKLIDLCKTLDIPVTLFTTAANINSHKINWTTEIKWIDYPTWWITKTFSVMTNPKQHEYNLNLGTDIYNTRVGLDESMQHLFITMNNRVKPHRCILMDILAKYDLIEQGAIAWRDVTPDFDGNRDVTVSESTLVGFDWKYWTPRKLLLDFPIYEDTTNVEQECLPPHYKHSFMQIIGETDHNLFFLSEKTAIPLLTNKVFLVAGSKNYHKILSDMGFLLYDELFDYSFDSEEMIEDRIEGIIQNVDRYRNFSMSKLEELLHSIEHKRLYNRKLAISYVYDLVPKELKDISQTIQCQLALLNNLKSILTNVY